ncbi:CP4-6 prophage; partial regulator of insertion element IS911A [Escherichia coli]|nr:CP4-6 prophage; partial regulator of insertion element IS911A [Escherichia coli]
MVVRQHLHHAYWRRGVGVDGIYHADAAHIDHRVTAKFRVIDNQHNVARVLNNGAFGANFVVIELQQRAVAIDAAYPQNAEIKAELGDKIERRFANDPAIAAVDSIGQRNSYVKTWGCGGFLNETNIYSRGKSLCF